LGFLLSCFDLSREKKRSTLAAGLLALDNSQSLMI
jgi:hypothetical protein